MGSRSINKNPLSSWLFIADKKDADGQIVEREFELFTSTMADSDMMLTIGPAIIEEVFVDRGYDLANVSLYKIFKVPLGVEEEDIDDDDDGGSKVENPANYA